MIPRIFVWIAVSTLVLCGFATAQPESSPKPESSQKPEKQETERERLEREFAEMMTGVDMVGHFTVHGRDIPPQEERYTIKSARKMIGDLWLITARIQYGGKDSTWPAPVKVKWAGDTPMITLTDVPVPGMGTFSARVLFFRDQYAGVWDGGDHGGQMFGRLERPAEKTGSNWPGFRGPNASGVAEGFPLPTKWDVESGENVAFKVDLPGLSHSSPVIWEDRLYTLTSMPKEGEAELKVGLYGSIDPVKDEPEQTFQLLCLNKHTGQMIWAKDFWTGLPAIPRHPKGSHAASSVATNGERIVAFLGSEGLFCFDMNGEVQWTRDFGVLDAGYFAMPQAQWGHASSPVIHDDKVVVQVDVQGQSWVGALSLKTGEDIWRREREEVPTWGTPTIHEGNGRTQVICNGWKEIAGYDLETGERLWHLAGGGDIPVPTPIVADELIFITNGHGKFSPVYAIPTDAGGQLSTLPTSKDLAWFDLRRGTYMQTPIAYGDLLYACKDMGVVSCFDRKTGELKYQERMGSTGFGGFGFTASPVAGDGKIYQVSEDGVVYVLSAGPEFEILQTNALKDNAMATPAISEGRIYFRTQHHLIAVGERRDSQ
ncbi:MAG: PQQ-binding-like beta-propeller repeat protein [Planctomycetota bacterium]